MLQRWAGLLAASIAVAGCKTPSSNPPYVQREGVHVKAPFVNVQSSAAGTQVKAPFTNVDTRSSSPAGSTTSVHAPVQKPQSLGAKTAPPQQPKAQNASAPSVSPLSSSSFYQQSSPGSYPPIRVNQ